MRDWPVSHTHRWLLSPADVDEAMEHGLAACWLEVSNAGGAVGFPFPPVSDDDVTAATERLVKGLDPEGTRVLVALDRDTLIGWLALELNRSRLTSHWARVFRVQTSLARRSSGVGRALMQEVARSARDDLHLEQLHLELRSGQGLEGFYESCGWQEVGRHVIAVLPIADGDLAVGSRPLPQRGSPRTSPSTSAPRLVLERPAANVLVGPYRR